MVGIIGDENLNLSSLTTKQVSWSQLYSIYDDEDIKFIQIKNGIGVVQMISISDDTMLCCFPKEETQRFL